MTTETIVTTGTTVSTVTSDNRDNSDNSDCRLKTLRHLVAALRTVGLVRLRGSNRPKYSGFSKIL